MNGSRSGTAGRRNIWLIAALGAIVTAAAIAYPIVATVANRSVAPERQKLSGFGGPFKLTDQDGRVVTDAEFRGKWLLLYFGYTHCPDACPTALNSIAEALDQLGPSRQKMQPIFITLDPERDTPATLKEYTGAFQAGILGLTGTPEEIAATAKEYRIAYQKHPIPENDDYSIDHTSVIFLVDPLGHPVDLFSHETPPDRMALRIKEAMG
jgi:protein SCO1/2